MLWSPTPVNLSAPISARTYGFSQPSETAVGVDLFAGKPISLDSRIKHLLATEFVFLDGHRLAGREDDHGQVVSFPEGKLLVDNLQIGGAKIAAVTHGDFLLLRPIKNFPAGLLDIRENITHIGLKHPAADIYDTQYISERDDGQIGLGSTTDGKVTSVVPMMESKLPALHAFAVSPDLKWIAISGRSRGAVWNLQENQRIIHTRGFSSAWLGDGNALYADYPPSGGMKRSLVHVDLSTAPPKFEPRELGAEDARVRQLGSLVIESRPDKKDDFRHNTVLEMRDVRNDKVLWSHRYAYSPPHWFFSRETGSLVLAWPLVDDEAYKTLDHDPLWRERVHNIFNVQGLVGVEVLDAATGIIRARILLDAGKGSFIPEQMFATRDRLFVFDNMQRLLAYSFDGKIQGRAFGSKAVAAPNGQFVTLETGLGRLAVFDAANLKEIDRLDFSSPIAAVAQGEGQLLVLCADQTAYAFDIRQLTERAAP
jgi:hypothetical protein